MFNHDMEQCIINDVVNKNHGSTIPSGQNTLETCACKIYFVDLPLLKSKHPSCTIAMAMKKPASANTTSTNRIAIADLVAELKSDEELWHDEQKDDEDQEKTKEEGKDKEIEGSKAKQVKPIQTQTKAKAKAKAKAKGVAKSKAKGKAKAKSSSSKVSGKKQDAKKDKVKKLVKKKKKQGQEKEEAGLLITSVLDLFAATCF